MAFHHPLDRNENTDAASASSRFEATTFEARVRHLSAPWYVLTLLDAYGRSPVTSPKELRHLLAAHEPRFSRAALYERVANLFQAFEHPVPEGLDTIPACWLAALPRLLWRVSLQMGPGVLAGVSLLECREYVLCVGFRHEGTTTRCGLSNFDRVRILLNLSVSPSRFRRPKPLRHALGRSPVRTLLRS